MYSVIEIYISKLYRSLHIKNPDQLNIRNLSHLLNIKVIYHDDFSFSMCEDNLVVLKKDEQLIEWQNFGHEVCHILRHVGNQMNMHELFVDLQEYQADYFAYHFCVPTFMLDEMELPNCLNAARSIVAERFNVEPKFAERRLEMWKNRICLV